MRPGVQWAPFLFLVLMGVGCGRPVVYVEDDPQLAAATRQAVDWWEEQAGRDLWDVRVTDDPERKVLLHTGIAVTVRHDMDRALAGTERHGPTSRRHWVEVFAWRMGDADLWTSVAHGLGHVAGLGHAERGNIMDPGCCGGVDVHQWQLDALDP